MKRGALIVFEGCDRAGKSTQLKKVADALRKENILNEIIAFPNRSTPVGKVIDCYLKQTTTLHDKAIHLLFSANRWELEPKICESIAKGITLLVDRYSFSGVAFSSAKKDMDAKWCWQPEIGLPKPDLVIFLSMPLNRIVTRSNFGDELYENANFQEKVIANFHEMSDPSWQPWQLNSLLYFLHSSNWSLKIGKTEVFQIEGPFACFGGFIVEIINADRDVNVIYEEIIKCVKNTISKVSGESFHRFT